MFTILSCSTCAYTSNERQTRYLDDYSKGLVLDKLGKRLEAIDVLVRSGAMYPYNWSCWLKIASLIDRSDEVNSLAPVPSEFLANKGSAFGS